jgi:outer membrane lipopolysaccharide assembly protein LptE/RlpB
MKRCMKVFLVVALCLGFAGACGYRFTGEGPGPRPGLTRIAIPVFENNTSEPDLGSMFAGALRQDFMQKGTMEVVPVEKAEAVFHGTISKLHTSDVAHRGQERTIESRLFLTLDIRCVDAKTGAVLWQDPKFTYQRVYVQSNDPIVSFENRRKALQFLATEMAIRIHDRFLANF